MAYAKSFIVLLALFLVSIGILYHPHHRSVPQGIKAPEKFESIDKTCYTIEPLPEGLGFLDVDVTFVITMNNQPERTKKAKQQLEILRPTNKVFILYNEGYKCSKRNPSTGNKVRWSGEDIAHANYTIFKECEIRNYNSVLVLEDDFTWTDISFQKDVQDDINLFLKEKYLRYNLGAICSLIPIKGLMKHHKCACLAPPAHSVIYSKRGYKRMIMRMENRPGLVHMDLGYPGRIHYYYKPLAVQSFPPSNNRNNWESKLYKAGISAMKLDINDENLSDRYLKVRRTTTAVQSSVIGIGLLIFVKLLPGQKNNDCTK